MADRKQTSEFLGGGPKFNVVGKDNKSAPGSEEAVVPIKQNTYWSRAILLGVLVLALAAALLYLNEGNLGKTELAPSHGGHIVSPDAKDAPPPPSLR
jgi:hypothetical protein